MTTITRIAFGRRETVIRPRTKWPHPLRQWLRWMKTLWGRA